MQLLSQASISEGSIDSAMIGSIFESMELGQHGKNASMALKVSVCSPFDPNSSLEFEHCVQKIFHLLIYFYWWGWCNTFLFLLLLYSFQSGGQTKNVVMQCFFVPWCLFGQRASSPPSGSEAHASCSPSCWPRSIMTMLNFFPFGNGLELTTCHILWEHCKNSLVGTTRDHSKVFVAVFGKNSLALCCFFYYCTIIRSAPPTAEF